MPSLGSRVTLGVLLTDLDLPSDRPLSWDPCGECTACVDACPGGALGDSKGSRKNRGDSRASPVGLDAARCLSYATTASREPIPPALRSQLASRLYGCDVCQESCPVNRDVVADIPAALQGPREIPLNRLHDLASLSGRAIRRALADSALSWLPPRIFLRTLAVVLGNLAQPESRPVLEALARDHHDAMVREHAAWALTTSSSLARRHGNHFRPYRMKPGG